MKTKKIFFPALLTILLAPILKPASAQIVDFYSSPGYSAMINNMVSNSIYKSSLDHYTKTYKKSSEASKSNRSNTSPVYEVPAYRRYPVVQFKSTGTRLTLHEYVDDVNTSPKKKAELKQLILKIFKDYEAAAAAQGYLNDWALAFVSFIGLNSHVYAGKREKPVISFGQDATLRDQIAGNIAANSSASAVTDRQKQELYETMVIGGCLTYHYYEKACKENNEEEIKNCRLVAEKNLKAVGINTALNADAPKEKFDIATFVAPLAWQRRDTFGTVAFTQTKNEGGSKRFCQIILYPSYNSSGDYDREFKTAWQNVVNIPFNLSVQPAVQKRYDKGWMALTGSATITVQNLTYQTTVTSFDGFGKTMNVQVNTNYDCSADITAFFNRLQLDARQQPAP